MTTKNEMLLRGITLALDFCKLNEVRLPAFVELRKGEPLHGLATCAFYRPETIRIMTDKCANKGFGGRAWSWPGYCIDRTPFGVIQHELGHHLDHVRSEPAKSPEDVETLFSWKIHSLSKEQPMTGYLGAYSNRRPAHFYMEWFAENFRVFVTNPNLSFSLRPKFHGALIAAGIKPLPFGGWRDRLAELAAPARIINQAEKKILQTTTN